MHEEERGLQRVLADSQLLAKKAPDKTSWHVGGTQLLIAVSGIGGDRAAIATEALIDGGARWVVCAGFAAALDRDIAAGDVVVASRVLRGDLSIPCNVEIAAAAPPNGAFKFAIRRGDLVTVDAVCLGASEKAALRECSGASALDMESYAVGQVCRSRGAPFAAIRSITDTAEENLPPEIAALAAIHTAVGRAAFAARRPGLWRTLLELRRRSRAAADNLGDVLGLILLRLI